MSIDRKEIQRLRLRAAIVDALLLWLMLCAIGFLVWKLLVVNIWPQAAMSVTPYLGLAIIAVFIAGIDLWQPKRKRPR